MAIAESENENANSRRHLSYSVYVPQGVEVVRALRGGQVRLTNSQEYRHQVLFLAMVTAIAP